LTSIQVERFKGNLPPVRAFDPPGHAEHLPVTGTAPL
jgi:hypothetical protein